MKKFHFMIVLIIPVVMISGCAVRYQGTGLDDFHRSSELFSESLTGIFSEIIDEDMALRAERSVDSSVISEKALEPVIVSYKNLRIRKELADSLVKYSRLLRSFFEDDPVSAMRKHGEDLRTSLSRIRDSQPEFITGKAAGIITSMITMVPEGMTFLRKKKFAVKLMGEMQLVIEKIFEKLKGEIRSLKLLGPNLYTRLFREQVEKRWPEKKEKRVKVALTGVKIIKKRELFTELTEDLLKIMDMVPLEHKKLMGRFGKKGGTLPGLTDLLNFSIRVKNNYEILAGGEE